jgi:hypothetical protein
MKKLLDHAGVVFLTAQAVFLGAATAAFGLPL